MAILTISNVAIKGMAAGVPEKTLDNMEYDYISVQEREMFIKTTGVRKRRAAEVGFTTSDLCYYAAEKLFKGLKWNKSDIQALVFVSQSRDYLLPATACIMQNRLGLLKSCLAFDLELGCSGYVYGLSVLGSMMQTGQIRRALLMVGDTSTFHTAYTDKSAYPLFGDAGTVTALEYKPTAGPMHFNLQTDGSGHEAIIIRDAGGRNYGSPASFEPVEYEPGIVHNRVQLELHGIEVFNFSLKEVNLNILDLLSTTDTSIDTIDFFFFHQANKLINESVRKKLKISSEKAPLSIEEYGNTSSASIPVTMLSQSAEKLSSGKNRILLCGFGVGLSWGSVWFDAEPFVCLPIIEVPKP